MDGKRIAASLRYEIFGKPKAAIIKVGDDYASNIYVDRKIKRAIELGIDIRLFDQYADSASIYSLIQNLNNDPNIHGVMMQLPVPQELMYLTDCIAPQKDIDGLTVYNQGLLAMNKEEQALLPCTAQACIAILENEPICGKNVLVIGRSILVGRPLSNMFLNRDATVTIAHSKTKNLAELCMNADIIVAAIGKKHFIQKEWIKSSSIVIDVGINRSDNDTICGDVEDSVIARKRSLVPGGIGPLTIAFLMKNILKAYKIQHS